MNDIRNKIEDYLTEDEEVFEDLEYFEDDTEVLESVLDFIETLDTEENNLTEDQQVMLADLIDSMANSGEVEEAFAAKKVKIPPAEKRKRKREYKKKRARLKLKQKQYRRTAKFKRWKRMKERKGKAGKTATGKRIRKFL